ncbi:type II secretion system F family protein [Paenibacillus hexagrammi]|uniref:Type II secretion system F family protein n=1 Tax=Paenibacillus hexagrammi TaxID=2908839 RepID=A0ABY3SRC1_9BACL|nr:type II secretion system F family protein [Paenibacillus sp. YPD9-1]UJF35955.1 type II secretion system F family protein [Paenibacillus sp. YPD9-1]
MKLIGLVLLVVFAVFSLLYWRDKRKSRSDDLSVNSSHHNPSARWTQPKSSARMVNSTDVKRTLMDGLTDYNEYELTKKQKLLAICMLGLPAMCVGFIFYKSLMMSLLISAIGFLFPRIRRKQLIRGRKNKLNVQFKQALSCLSSAMTAGKSIESAFKEALEDLRVLYPDPSCLIVVEFSILCRRVENGEPIETALYSFAERSHIEDIQNFADVLLTCKRTGGNLIEVMKRTASVIGEKLDITQDIAVMVAQKKFESKVLLFAPVMIVAVLAFSSPDYMEPLYQGAGKLIMSASIAVLAVCYWLTQKIMDIKV